MLVALEDLLAHARARAYALPVFETGDLDGLHEVLEAAEAADSPVVLTPPPGLAAGRREVLLAAMEAAAKPARVPVVLYGTAIEDSATAAAAINAGCNALELADGADGEAVLAVARGCGVPICAPREGEGVVCLKGDAETLPARGALPLAVRAATESADACRALVDAGVALVHVKDVTPARAMALWNAAGQAGDARGRCRPWMPVEHLIVFNAEGITEAEAEAMMRDGRRILGAIPGVRRVFIGSAMKEDARYRYCWLVRFVHPAVIASYRDHPDHVDFADRRFRPVAGDRVSIDYRELPD